jgi:tetratricopeptide (TPR) repeat protein
MKKIIVVICFIIFCCTSFGQTFNYRTAEDGLNKLINNPDFIQDVIKSGSTDFSIEKLGEYLTKYVPEYRDFKVDNSKIDFTKLYYANTEDAPGDVLADKLGKLLNVNPALAQTLKGSITGNYSYKPATTLSTGLGNSLYERGKDAKVDFVVDYSVDFFQNKFGDGGLNSSLIDIGGGLLGGLILKSNQRYDQRMADAARQQALNEDNYVYTQGQNFSVMADNMRTKNKSDEPQIKPEQKDLYLHFKAKQKMPNNDGPFGLMDKIDFEGAIKLLDQAIDLYNKNPDRGYYLYMAYAQRAQCKMQLAAYRAAIIDFYFAQKTLDYILTNKLTDNSIKTTYPDGYFDYQNKSTYLKGKPKVEIGVLSNNDLVNIIISRAFAKYRSDDFNGAIADAELGIKTLVTKNIASTSKPNDYKDIIKAIIGMSQFGLAKYTEAYKTFSTANLNDELIADSDDDGITNFRDIYDNSILNNPFVIKDLGKTIYYGLPSYFPFDVIQIKGLTYYKAGKIDEAITMYENIVSSETDNSAYGARKRIFTKVGGDISTVLSSLASFYAEKGNLPKSISLLDDAISLNPQQLEYYYKRGTYKKANNQLAESEADFNIVKNPKIVTDAKVQNLEYYITKYEQSIALNNKFDEIKVIKEALTANPAHELFGGWALTYLVNAQVKNKEDANSLAELCKPNPKIHHVLKSLYYSYSADNQKEEEEIFKAFENGLNFYQLEYLPTLRFIQQKKYYCKLMSSHISRSNNTFIPPDFNKEKMKKTLDSVYASIEGKYEVKGVGSKMVNKMMVQQQKENMAKSLGEFEEYLRLLEENKQMLEISATHIMDKVEVLFILNRKAEAIEFAKKAFGSGKLMKHPVDESNPYTRFMNMDYYKVENIVKYGCN